MYRFVCIDRGVLLVGGAGYVGSVLTSCLLENGYSVTCLDRMIYRHYHTVWPFLGCEGYRFIRGDMGNPADLGRGLEGVRHVVILAGLVGDPITRKYQRESEAINVGGIRTLLDGLEGKNLEHVVFVSTCSNYGLTPGNVEATEDYELTPLSLYAKDKVESEQWLLGLKGSVDYSATVLRFATAFGFSPWMRFDLTVSEFTRELYLGHELLVFDAHTWRPYCHVKDLSEAIRCVLEAQHDRVHFEVFNVGGEANSFTKQAIVNEILCQVPEGKVKYQEHGSDPRNYRVSFEKIREQLGFSIQYSVGRGVEELLGALREGLFDNVESQRS
jgi:nucleoside-diphosphate-sugar epimerase